MSNSESNSDPQKRPAGTVPRFRTAPTAEQLLPSAEPDVVCEVVEVSNVHEGDRIEFPFPDEPGYRTVERVAILPDAPLVEGAKPPTMSVVHFDGPPVATTSGSRNWLRVRCPGGQVVRREVRS